MWWNQNLNSTVWCHICTFNLLTFGQWLSNFSMHQNALEGFSKHRLLCSIFQRLWFSRSGGKTWEWAFVRHPQVMLVSLEQRNCILYSIASGQEQKSLQLKRSSGGLCLPHGSVLRDPGDVLICRFQLPLQEDQTTGYRYHPAWENSALAALTEYNISGNS